MSDAGDPVDRWADVDAVALVLAAGAGAALALPIPRWVAAIGLAAAVLAKRRALVVVSCFGLVSALAAHAWLSLEPPVPGPFSGEVTLATDPAPVPGGVRFEVSVQGRRLDGAAYGYQAGRLRPRSAGERVTLAGRVRPVAAGRAFADGSRHVAGRLSVDRVESWRPGSWWWQAANTVRSRLVKGASVLPDDRRSLLSGLVLGDDREQSDDMEAAFEGAGLTHLLAVSGQNVVFVLAAVAPVLGRLRLRGRFVATILVLAFFATCTRFEPSVLRAVAMAGSAAAASFLGRPASSLRVLCIAVSGVLAVDPLLVWRLGFQLSVLATAGIVVLASPLAERLPGPAFVTLPLGVTLAAQACTAPLLALRFGSVPIASVPANLLAEPAAGAAMVYGLVGGLLAGVLPDPAARVVHLPTSVLLWWIDAVARWASGLGLPSLGLRGVALGWLSVLAVLAGRRLRGRRRLATVVAVRAPVPRRDTTLR